MLLYKKWPTRKKCVLYFYLKTPEFSWSHKLLCARNENISKRRRQDKKYRIYDDKGRDKK